MRQAWLLPVGLLACLFAAVGNAQKANSVQLVGGLTPNYGIVEVRLSTGVVGRICDVGFDNNGASAVCAMLGYRGVTGLKVSLPPYKTGNTATVMAITGCPSFLEGSPNTWNLDNACQSIFTAFPTSCNDNARDAGVICTGTMTTNTPGTPGPTRAPDFATVAPIFCNNTITSLRLEPGIEEGLVIIQNGSAGGTNFGTICADDFGANEAATICRMLCRNETSNAIGLSGRYLSISATYPVMLSGLKCPAGATSINSCQRRGWGEAPGYCTRNAAVTVRCTQISLTPPPIPAPSVLCYLYAANVYFSPRDVASSSLLSLHGPYNATTCNFTKGENSSTVWAIIPYLGCNSVQTTNSTHVIYTSMLYRNVTTVNGIYVDTPYIIPVVCAIPKLSLVTASMQPDARTAPPIAGGDSYTSEIKLYTGYGASGFSDEIKLGDRLIVGSRIYASVRETSPLNVRLTVRDCWATNQRDGTGAKYYVVNKKCATDTNAIFRVDSKTIGINFVVMSFTERVSTSVQAYIFCDVTICTETDPDERCLQVCGTAVRRRRRSSSPVSDRRQDQEQPHRGPFILSPAGAVQAAFYASVTTRVAANWLATALLVITGWRLVAWG